MKFNILLPVALLACGFTVQAGNVVVRLPHKPANDTVFLSHVTMNELLSSSRRPEMKLDTIVVDAASFTLNPEVTENTRFDLILNPENKSVTWYAAPSDNLIIDVTAVDPLDYTVGGSPLMDGITTLSKTLNPIEARFNELAMQQPRDQEAMMALADQYNLAIETFIKENPSSQAATFALINYDGDNYDSLYEMLTPEARQSMFFDVATQQKEAIAQRKEAEKRQNELSAGNLEAPEFSLPSLNGGNIALSDLRGKWVIIDFWGSWCPWCIKGFPSLKEAYTKYAGKLEILGVDCGDTEQAWRDAVKKFDLPWKNVYNPVKEGGVLEQYAVQGFPTKVIVNPDGKIADLVVGEDPEFFVKLDRLINGK